MYCKYCNEKMKHILSFEHGKAYEFYACPKCYAQSRRATYKYDDKLTDGKKKKMKKKSKKHKKGEM